MNCQRISHGKQTLNCLLWISVFGYKNEDSLEKRAYTTDITNISHYMLCAHLHILSCFMHRLVFIAC